MVKKFVMTIVWRISQTGPLLSLFFWSTALAGIFWPILGSTNPRGPLLAFVVDVLGVPAERATIVGLLLLFLLFSGIILGIGFLYDRVLRLWREQMDVAYERNPYADDRLFRKERLQWEQFYLPLARAMYKVSPDPEFKQAIERVENWVATGRIDSGKKT
ncbi:MAG: hypothetical protein HY557_07900 [Euryarchaeota archaeon]|nr:hypothetical protein [Euryarchaeota archaeon]